MSAFVATHRYGVYAFEAVALGVLLTACASTNTSSAQPSSGPPASGASVQSSPATTRCPADSCVAVDGVEFVVSHVDRAAPPAPNTAPLPAEQHYVAFDVSFLDLAGGRVIDSSNLDPLSGVPLVAPPSLSGADLGASDGSTGAAGIGLADGGGPVIGRTSQGSTAFEWRDGIGVGTACESALPVSSTASVASSVSASSSRPTDNPVVGGGGVIIQNGPTKTLEKGEVYGPVRLCFAVAGPVDQRLSIVWAPAPFTQGSPQPPTQYVVLTP